MMTGNGKLSIPTARPETSKRSGLIGRLRGDLLFVVSAIGTALTVISALQNTLTVASWARALVDSFQAAASGFWAFALPWLTVSPRPMDVLFLNMSVFLAVIGIGSLSPRSEVPESWRDLKWRTELLASLGGTLAIAVFIWAGLNSIQEHLNGPAASQFMAAIESAKTVQQGEAAALSYMTEISAFIPIVDSFGQIVGLTSGPLPERLNTVALMLLALHVAIVLAPFLTIVGVGALLGTRMDSRKLSRWSWLFLALFSATLALGWFSGAWSSMCASGGDSAIHQLCRIAG